MTSAIELNTLSSALPKAPSLKDKPGSAKIVELAQRTLDSRGKPIWTHQDFDWAYRNPLATVLKRGNDYVTEQWSEEYIIATKRDVGLFKESIKNVGLSLWHGCHVVDAAKHLVNALAVVAKLALNIEAANFLKGVLGVLISSGKSVFHIVAAAVYLGLTIFSIVLCPSKTKKLFVEMLCNLGFFVKDLVSIFTCVGHAIPSWLPIAILFICPPAGIALTLVKWASDFTGIFDVMAYGGTAILLGTKAYFAKRDLAKDPNNEEARKATEAWTNLKKELNPFKSIEGAALGLFALNVLTEGAATVVDIFAPGAGTLAKNIRYAVMGGSAVGLGAANYWNYRKGKKSEEAAAALKSTRADSEPVITKIDPPKPKKEVKSAWGRIKPKLHPFKSYTGAILAMGALYGLTEGIAWLTDAGAKARYAGYGLLAATGAALGALNYNNHRN